MSIRAAALRFGPPIFVPVSTTDEWVVAGVDNDGDDRTPVGVLVFGAEREGFPSVRTTERSESQPLFVDVMNILSASVPRGDISLPLSLTVTERTSDLVVDGERFACRILETGRAWRATATIDGRLLSAAGTGEVPETLAFARLTDLDGAKPSRFR